MIAGSLFTRDYLLEGIERTDQWKALTDKDVLAIKTRLMAIAQNFLKTAKPNEAETEKELIYPVIEVLGWGDYQVQQILSKKRAEASSGCFALRGRVNKTSCSERSSAMEAILAWPCRIRSKEMAKSP